MIRNLLATTAVAALLATGAYAQENANQVTTDPAAPATEAPATGAAGATQAESGMTQIQGHLASNLIGETVYNGTGDNAENIGEVNDLVVSNDGQVESLVIGVGGFLGIGERDVAIEFDQAQWSERDGDRWLVVPMTREQLEGMTAFDRSVYEPAPAPVAANDAATGDAATTDMAAAPATTTTTTEPAADQTAQGTGQATGTAPATDDQTAADTGTAAGAATDTTETGAIDRSQLTEVPSGDIRAEDIVGTTVYGADDANVGEIGDVVLTADGKVDAFIIDVGGFLGIGEKEVAIGADNLTFMQDANGNRYLYTTFTKEQLEAQTAYDEGTYAQNRDQQRLTVSQ